MSGFDNTSYTVRTVTGTTDTLLQTDFVTVYTNAAVKTVSLPAVATVQPGRVYWIISQNTGVLTIDPAGSELINGNATQALTAGTATGVTGRAGIVSDGTQWFTLYSQ